MGAVITCSLGLGFGVALSAAGNAADAAAAAPAAAGSTPRCATCGTAWGAATGIRLMRSASSPSLISISAMPDSSSNSISFLIFRMSMPGMPPQRSGNWPKRRTSGAGCEPLRGGAYGRLVTECAQAGDDPDCDVREIGMPAKRLAGVRVGQVHFDEGHTGAEDGVAQRDAGVRERARIDDHERHALGAGPMDALDQLVFGVTLERDQLVPELAGNRRRALLDRLERVGAVQGRFPRAEQIEVRAVQ